MTAAQEDRLHRVRSRRSQSVRSGGTSPRFRYSARLSIRNHRFTQHLAARFPIEQSQRACGVEERRPHVAGRPLGANDRQRTFQLLQRARRRVGHEQRVREKRQPHAVHEACGTTGATRALDRLLREHDRVLILVCRRQREVQVAPRLLDHRMIGSEANRESRDRLPVHGDRGLGVSVAVNDSCLEHQQLARARVLRPECCLELQRELPGSAPSRARAHRPATASSRGCALARPLPVISGEARSHLGEQLFGRCVRSAQ